MFQLLPVATVATAAITTVAFAKAKVTMAFVVMMEARV